MFSKILIKLIDRAITPAILLLAMRIISVVMITKYFGYPMNAGQTGFIFTDRTAYLNVNSYSLLAMIAALLIGILYIIIKSYTFHDTHITPSLTAKLFSFHASGLIQNSYEIYSQGVVWVSYLYLLLAISGIMAVYGLIYTSVFYIALTLTVIVTTLFILDIEREISIHKLKGAKFDEDSAYFDQGE